MSILNTLSSNGGFPIEKMKILGVIYTNGSIPSDMLKAVATDEEGPILLYKYAAESLERIKKYIEDNNIKHTWKINDGFRPIGAPGDYKRKKADRLKLYGASFTQWYAWEAYKSHGGNLAATPGSSKHGFSVALDVEGDNNNPISSKSVGSYKWPDGKVKKRDAFQKWLSDNGEPYGWVWTGTSFAPKVEPWHFQYYPEKDVYIKIPQTVNYVELKKTPSEQNSATFLLKESADVLNSISNIITGIFK